MAAVDRLLGDIRALIETAREQTARTVNLTLVGLCWNIGTRIRKDVLDEKRAAYGEAIVSTLSKQLTAQYGRGYSKPNLSRMMWLAEAFPDPDIVSTLSKQLSWSHFVELLPLKDPLKRDFYAELCRLEHWNVRMLRHKIRHLLFERTAVSKKPEELIAHDLATLRDEDRMTPDLMRQARGSVKCDSGSNRHFGVQVGKQAEHKITVEVFLVGKLEHAVNRIDSLSGAQSVFFQDPILI
jgi:DUF1016 N-terminal domain